VVDKHEIEKTLLTYFIMDGEFEVKDNGSVTVYGNVFARRAMPTIPVKFSSIDGILQIAHCELQSLKNCPNRLGNLSVYGNRLGNCVGLPTHVLGWLDISDNPLKTLEGFPKSVGGHVDITYTLALPLLRLLVAPEVIFRLPKDAGATLDQTTHARDRVKAILDKYMGKGKRAMFDCQKELEDAGFGENARW